MNIVNEDTDTLRCVRHPNRETALRCGKCGDPICTRCMVQTPVGARCASCAQLRRLPQFQFDPVLFGRASIAGLVVSIAGWWVLSYVYFLRFFLSILLGVAVGEAMSRAARKRTHLVLEVTAVVAVVAGAVLVEGIRSGRGMQVFTEQSALVYLTFPILVASFVAVVKLR